MPTLLSMYTNSIEAFFLEFLEKIEGIKIVDIVQNDNNYSNKAILVPHDLEELKRDKFIYWCNENMSEGTIVLLPKNTNYKEKYKKLIFIKYPLSILNFEKIIFKKEVEKNFKFSSLLLNGNKLINLNNNNTTVLTDTEKNILSALFKSLKIQRNHLEKKVLHFAEGVQSKSLDSHLARIRKKIYQIDSKISISSIDSKYIILSNT